MSVLFNQVGMDESKGGLESRPLKVVTWFFPNHHNFLPCLCAGNLSTHIVACVLSNDILMSL